MSTRTDTAKDLIPTLRTALVALDDALDNLSEADTADQWSRVIDVIAAEDSVFRLLGQIRDSIDSILA